MSIGEFRPVENERDLIIKFKMTACPVKVRSGLTPGKYDEKSAEALRRCHFHRTCFSVQKS